VLAAHVTPYDPAAQRMLSQAQAMLMRSGADPVTANRQAMAMVYGVVRQQASVLSFLTVFQMMGIVFLVIIPLVLLLRKPQHLRGAGPRPASHP
jgi:DHA2 family multidrug resistance protein